MLTKLPTKLLVTRKIFYQKDELLISATKCIILEQILKLSPDQSFQKIDIKV